MVVTHLINRPRQVVTAAVAQVYQQVPRQVVVTVRLIQAAVAVRQVIRVINPVTVDQVLYI